MNEEQLYEKLLNSKKKEDKQSAIFRNVCCILVFSIVLVPLLPLFVILFLLCTSRNNEKDIIINEFKLFFESKFNIIANNYLIQNNERYLIECKKIKAENIKLIDKRINDFYLDQIAIDKICDFENISKKIEEISKKINKEIEIELDREEKLSSFLLNHTGLSILEVEIKKIYNVLTLSVNNHTCIGKKIMIICSKYAEPKINDVISVKGYKLPFTNEYVPNSIITGIVTNIFKMNMDNLKRVTDANITDTIQIRNYELKKSSKIYNNHCWNCKDSISNSLNFLCPSCKKYYVCGYCGKCKCGFSDVFFEK